MTWEVAAIGMFIGVSFMFVYIASTLESKHDLLKMFLILGSFFPLLIGLASLKPMLDANSITTQALITNYGMAYWGFMIFLVSTIFYFMGAFVFSLFKRFGE